MRKISKKNNQKRKYSSVKRGGSTYGSPTMAKSSGTKSRSKSPTGDKSSGTKSRSKSPTRAKSPRGRSPTRSISPTGAKSSGSKSMSKSPTRAKANNNAPKVGEGAHWPQRRTPRKPIIRKYPPTSNGWGANLNKAV
jgi:hypothetical protein